MSKNIKVYLEIVRVGFTVKLNLGLLRLEKGNDSSGIVICGVSLFEVRKKPMTSYVE